MNPWRKADVRGHVGRGENHPLSARQPPQSGRPSEIGARMKKPKSVSLNRENNRYFMSLIARLVGKLNDCLKRRANRRPKLRRDDVIEVLHMDPYPRWAVHEFVDWADAPLTCPTCSGSIANSRVVLRSTEGERRNIVVSYQFCRSNTIGWRVRRGKLKEVVMKFGRCEEGETEAHTEVKSW